MKRPAPRRTFGYTLIEVMMGVALSAIGIVGITFMQTASVRSNQDAYESMVASNFARTWLERVKRDAILWTTIGAPVTGTIFAGRNNAGGNNYFNPTNSQWTAPQTMLRGLTQQHESSSANYHGVELGSPDPFNGGIPVDKDQIYYCVHLRFNTVESDAAGQTVAMGVDARVYWARKGSLEVTQYDSMRPARATASGCDDPPAVYTDAQIAAAVTCQLNGSNNYCLRVHYLRTVIRWVPP